MLSNSTRDLARNVCSFYPLLNNSKKVWMNGFTSGVLFARDAFLFDSSDHVLPADSLICQAPNDQKEVESDARASD